MKLLQTIILLVILSLVASCAKIPQESVELSVALGDRIASLEQAHLALLDSFFAEKERQVDRFIREEWAPQFSKNFLSNPQISDKWQQISSTNDPAARQKFLEGVGPTIQQKIFERRQLLLEPLAASERQLRRQLQESYLQAYSMNDSLTQLLSSAATLQQKQQYYQRLLGIEEDKISAGLSKVDAAVGKLNNKADAVTSQVARGEAYLQLLKELLQPAT